MIPPAIVLARFKRHFPAEYRAAHYRTRDSVIPFGLFWILYATMTHDLALDRVNQTRAISHALAVAFGNEKAAEFTQRELVEAFLSAPT